MPESLWEKSCQVSDPGDGTPLPPHSFYLDRACSSHTTAERKKIQTITISQDLLPEPAKEGEEARGASEFSEAAAEGQGSGTQVWGPDGGGTVPAGRLLLLLLSRAG